MLGKACVLLFDGYADWELGHILAELRRFAKVEVVSVGFTAKSVISMGGLRVTPDTALAQVDEKDIQIFILPGGHLWERGYPAAEIEPFLQSLDRAAIPIAAICAATTVLARAGLLKGRRHTSNSRKFLSRMVPDYADGDCFVDALATHDQHIITASGLGAVEFTVEIFNTLDLATAEIRTAWYDAFKHGIYPEGYE